MVFANYFDFWNIFRNEVFGSTLLFMIVTVMLLALFLIKKNMFSITNLLLISLWFVVLYIKTQVLLIWIFLIIGYSFIAFSSMNKSFTR